MSRASAITTDPIADMLSRIRNAAIVNHTEVSLPHSKTKETVAKILVDSGFLAGVQANDDNGKKMLVIKVNNEDEPSKITSISRLSRPGRRMYVKATAIPKVRSGRGIVVISTSHGIMTGQQAASKHLGGELICEVY